MNTRRETPAAAAAQARPPRRRRPLLAGALWKAGDALLIGGVACGLWLAHANRVPNVAIPEPTLPAVNGYDRLATAGAAQVRPDEVSAAVGGGEYPRGRPKRVLSLADKEALVADNAASLAGIRAAMALPVQVPPVRTTEQAFPEFARIRASARLLRLEGEVHEARGDAARAAASYLDAMEVGGDLMPDAWMLPRLVGIACEAIGRRPLVRLADTLSAADARAAASRLEAILAARAPIADSFAQEKWGLQRILLHEFRRGRVDDFAAKMFCTLLGDGETAEPDLPTRATLIAWTLPLTKAGVMRANADYMDRLIATSRLPYPVAAARTVEEPADLINRRLAPVFVGVIHKEADSRAQSALLLGKLALRAYAGERGGLPASLGELASAGYLKASPADPFAADGAKSALRYRRLSATEYLLYSVGPDGADDGGRPIENRYGDGRQKPWTHPDSRGDFVLGANLY